MASSKHTFLFTWLLATLNLLGQSADGKLAFDFPKVDTLNSTLLKCWGTFYAIHQINTKGKVPFLDHKGKSMGFKADTCDFCIAALEGTVVVKDEAGRTTVLNFESYGDSSVVDCKKCKRFASSKLDVSKWGQKRWFVSSGYGHGVKGYHLIPFRTIAVDPNKILYGSVVYVPEARGLPLVLPDGTQTRHDGYFFAGDGGSAIEGHHIDFFIGTSHINPFKGFVKSVPGEKFNAYLVSDTSIIKVLKERHMRK